MKLILILAAGTAFAQTTCPTNVFLDVSKYPGAGAAYPKPTLQVTCTADQMTVRGNGIPQYEFVPVTPNALAAANNVFTITTKPQKAGEVTPIPLLGTAGFAVNGIPFFGPNEGAVPQLERFGDPIYNAIMDECMGHTAMQYHYHAFNQACLVDGYRDGQPSPVLGYALDGYPIHGPYECADADCSKVIVMKSAWERTGDPKIKAWEAYTFVPKESAEYLDQCNGHQGPKGDYHYHSTNTFPYIIGCYAGVVRLQQGPGGGAGPGGPGLGGPGPGGPGPGGMDTAFTRAATRLGKTLDEVMAAVDARAYMAYVNDPDNTLFDYAAAASRLRVEEEALREALDQQIVSGLRYRGHRPGCTITAEGFVVCHPKSAKGIVDAMKEARP